MRFGSSAIFLLVGVVALLSFTLGGATIWFHSETFIKWKPTILYWLFASGLLPTRTPDGVYRAVTLQRQPSFVGVDRIGTLPYMVAAAPVRAGGRDAILTVPLADRQRGHFRLGHDIHSVISVPSAGICQPACSTVFRSSEPASRAGLELLICRNSFRPISRPARLSIAPCSPDIEI